MGSIIRRILNSDKIYLTFDDGPDPELTPLVLDLLLEHSITASFFVIGEKSVSNRALIERMVSEGHGVFSHSTDHRYAHYFKNEKHLKEWIRKSLDELAQLLGHPTKLFRPPAGVLTPPLMEVAKNLGVPLILWQHRFYDALWPLYQWHCRLKIKRIKGGDILLLHDHQLSGNRILFLSSLRFLLDSFKTRQFSTLSEKEL